MILVDCFCFCLDSEFVFLHYENGFELGVCLQSLLILGFIRFYFLKIKYKFYVLLQRFLKTYLCIKDESYLFKTINLHLKNN